MRRLAPFYVTTLMFLGLSAGGCGDKAKYKAEPPYSGPKASLPKPPTLLGPAKYKDGSDWTIYGLQHQLNNPRHRAEVDGKQISVTGYVVDVYRPQEPAGKEGCIYPQKKHPPTSKQPTPPPANLCDNVKYEPPHFYIADSKDEKNKAKWVTVMGYASSFIQQYMAWDYYKGKGGPEKIASMKPEDQYLDNNYSSNITILGEPKVGAKLSVFGQFGSKYEEGQGGRRTSPAGIIDVTSHKKGKLEYKEGQEEVISLR